MHLLHRIRMEGLGLLTNGMASGDFISALRTCRLCRWWKECATANMAGMGRGACVLGDANACVTYFFFWFLRGGEAEWEGGVGYGEACTFCTSFTPFYCLCSASFAVVTCVVHWSGLVCGKDLFATCLFFFK